MFAAHPKPRMPTLNRVFLAALWRSHRATPNQGQFPGVAEDTPTTKTTPRHANHPNLQNQQIFGAKIRYGESVVVFFENRNGAVIKTVSLGKRRKARRMAARTDFKGCPGWGRVGILCWAYPSIRRRRPAGCPCG
jgi:hypothetical protein